ncbi:hypothetical protein H4217_002877 [Coemansia sp. RSA 1939]|nr:hypothetical protein H4217_002877 [Coemansia sp. RSA 1939]KAJ2612802.1 hypothetical protein EV177_002810 [Coemansia sp. RSA 1804]
MFVRTIKAAGPAALGAAAAVGIASTPIHADYDSTAAKKTIYDQQAAAPPAAQPRESGVADAVPRVVAYTRAARAQAAAAARVAGGHGQAAVERWIAAEQRVAAVVRRTVPRGESLAPGIVYVGVAALAGPIFTRRRNFAVRWASPVLFASAAAVCFLPGTAAVVARNVWGRYGDPAAIDAVAARWDAARLAVRRLSLRAAAVVQELRMAMQEGRPFSPPPPARQGQTSGRARQIEGEVRGAVEKTEDFVASLAAAAAENIRNDVSAAKQTTYDNVLELPAGVSHDAGPGKSEEQQLPLGFKHKAD